MEAEWEHVECRVSRDHGTKERERREKDLRRYHDQGGEEGGSERERRREESKREKMARMKRALESEGQEKRRRLRDEGQEGEGDQSRDHSTKRARIKKAHDDGPLALAGALAPPVRVT